MIESAFPILSTPILEEVDQPWGERVARVADRDGNVVIVGARAMIAPG